MTTVTKMRLSKDTYNILKNFASINSNILVNPGSVITTISPVKNVLAEAKVDETFGRQFSIWDLNKFLGTVSLFKDPEFIFEQNYITIKNGNSGLKYYYCDPKLVMSTNKKVSMPKAVVSFTLKAKDFSELLKAASVLQVQNLFVQPSEDGKHVEIVARDKSDVTSNQYSIIVGDYEGTADFQFIFDVENLKILPGDYQVEISEKVVSKFSNKNEPLTYWIAVHADSSYTA
jgi:hypothetical protein